MRDPYNFDFLTLRDQAAERELEDGLLAHIRKFLIELGAGFAVVGTTEVRPHYTRPRTSATMTSSRT